MNVRAFILRGQIMTWLFMLLVAVAVLLGIDRNAQLARQAAHSQAELTQLETVLSLVLDLETGMRGYLLSGRDSYLAPHRSARSRLPGELRELARLIEQDPQGGADAQRRIVQRIETLLITWNDEAAAPQIAARRRGLEDAVALVMTERGKRLVDDIRREIERYRSAEAALRDRRVQASEQALQFVEGLTILGLLAAVLASVLAANRSAHKVAQTFEQLGQASRRIAGGHFGERVAPSEIREADLLAGTFNSMAEHLHASQLALEERNLALSRQAADLEQAARFERSLGESLRLFTASYDRTAILNGVLSLLARQYGLVAGAFYGYHEWRGDLSLEARYGLSREVAYSYRLREGQVGQAVMERRVLLLPDTAFVPVDSGLECGTARHTVVVPVYLQDRIMGCLVLALAQAPAENVLTFLQQLAQQLGVALNNIDQYTNLQILSAQLQARSAEVDLKNRELQHADRLKSEFLANMSHELRTPLNAVIGFSELLAEQVYGPLNERQLGYLREIQHSGEHLLNLINDILDLSKIEAGRMDLALEAVRLTDVLRSAEAMLRERALSGGLTLEVHSEDLEFRGDPRKLRQVVVNLLSNAVKFTPTGGRVSLEGRRSGDRIEIVVTDTGIGIAEADQAELFQPFTQVDGSLARRHEGTGLGLALTRRLGELHGGTVSVRSAPRQGSTFTVSLPFEAAPPAGLPAQKTAVTGGQPVPREGAPLILIVEDDDAVATLIRHHLEDAGYRVARAPDGVEGLRMASELRPDAISLDLMMPVLDGWAFLERLAQQPELAKIPVVVLSMASNLERGLYLGASAVLNKPVRREQLLDAFARILPALGGPAHVLVIDDDPQAVELVAETLAPLGHRVVRTYGGQQGLDQALKEPPDLIVLDLMMPGVSGFEVVERLYEDARTREVPVIILTAKVVTEEDRRRLNGHIFEVLEKGGFNRSTLLSEVARATRRLPPTGTP
ncbi:signal transduction histidine kinase/DNA-binding response OmpR family regulator/CHASE3 domain sensor protein [Deinobacterium chartae]|uniref:histidine kinase n=1 Tax=Deinobacterium chartae TaxID=521158 RepID=A0A841HWI0_9DEIO|nr:signal transduction histidine kinase/DNA-binding response OmpR family regulator/CHASE3 domain sensor protein [Deinobacterium chartae]